MNSQFKNTSGFSILIAISVIGILLIIVTSLSITYIRESKLSRYSYNDVLVKSNAEGMFEYAMLKVKNHKDGFQDQVFNSEKDGELLKLGTPRSTGLQGEYSISASSTGHTFVLSGSEHLVVPLFVSSGSASLGVSSLSPMYHTGVMNTTNLNIFGLSGLSWAIVAQNGGESLAINGVGDIFPAKTGIIRIKKSQCYDDLDGGPISCAGITGGDEELLFSYDKTMNIGDFLTTYTDPYFVVYNPSNSPIDINMSATSPFSLPTMTFTTRASKGDSSQIFQFNEDKSKYYDALKYGIYNTSP
ncbi:hypothetical protein K2X92_01840 [Candidatus Gracilibacteria bacterium]|nr:hypothetical protein [Candidatus Gracilibacteria bacterium]